MRKYINKPSNYRGKSLKRGGKQMAKRVPFGGMKIKPDANLGKIIGSTAVAPSEMTKKIWAYIKRNKLLKR